MLFRAPRRMMALMKRDEIVATMFDDAGVKDYITSLFNGPTGAWRTGASIDSMQRKRNT
jgi:hypothetical protein